MRSGRAALTHPLLSIQHTYLWRLCALVCAAVLLQLQAEAQRTVVEGTVYDAETKEPLPFVSVAFKDSKIGTTTDINGYFKLESYYATDTLLASSVGYQLKAVGVEKDRAQQLELFLEPGSFKLSEVVVSAKDFRDPALVLLDKILEHKDINNREKLDAYQYETYNKIQFDLNNISEKFTQRKIFNQFDFIFDRIDSTREKVALPFFLTESLSDYYFQRDPRGRKEIIRASKVSGINNESISQFLGQMYQDINIYQNSMSIFGKNFVSPIATYATAYYTYDLVDSMFIDSKWCYRMNFTPKNSSELVFTGHMWVNDTSYAVKELEAAILPTANINFVQELKLSEYYREVEPEVWMLTREKLLVDFALLESEVGFYATKLTTYRDFVINQPKDEDFYGGAEPVIVETVVNEKSEDYWKNARHQTITSDQQAIYDMVDSLKSNSAFMTYVDLINFLVVGYEVVGPVEIGPIFTFLSYNDVEGLRPKFGLRTSNDFSTRLLLEGYAAYGLKDETWKYMLGGQYYVSKKPRQLLGAYYSREMELVGQVPNIFGRDHWIQSFTNRNPQNRLIFKKEARLFTEREWFAGFSTRIEFKHSTMEARGDWQFLRAPLLDDAPEPRLIQDITTSELSISARFAFRERFVSGEFERVSLGSRWPIIKVKADFGIKGVLDSQYEYQKLTASIQDEIPAGPFGNFYYTLEAGKTWQALPFPLQFVHAGNESIFLNVLAFNTMNYFEFVSDRYASVRAEHHFEGLFFNKVPLLKKLKWRELIGVNTIYGQFNDDNLNELLLPAQTYGFDSRPFIETYVGIENIFRLFRIDAIWRLSYLEHPNTQKFGILIGFDLQF